MTEDEQLQALCVKLGSSPAQLQKRAAQLAVERGITREAALAHLLNLVVKGRSGEAPPGFPATNPGK